MARCRLTNFSFRRKRRRQGTKRQLTTDCIGFCVAGKKMLVPRFNSRVSTRTIGVVKKLFPKEGMCPICTHSVVINNKGVRYVARRVPTSSKEVKKT